MQVCACVSLTTEQAFVSDQHPGHVERILIVGFKPHVDHLRKQTLLEPNGTRRNQGHTGHFLQQMVPECGRGHHRASVDRA